MVYGILDTQHIDFPANVDVAYLQGLRTAAGVSFPTVLSEIDGRLTAFNGALDPLLAQLLTTTTEAFAESLAPVAFEVTERGEYTVARPQQAEGEGHMLAIRGWDVSLGFTEDGLESMRLPTILQQIDSLLLGLRVRQRKEALRRLFDDAEIRVDRKTTATSPGFAGSGTGGNVFARSYPDGTPLPGGYTHYYRAASADLAVTLKAGRDRLRKWHQGPFDLIAPAAQVAAIMALPDFVKSGSALIRLGSGANEALVDPALYVGVYDNDIRVRLAIEDFSEANIALFKTYGALNERNPLVWRYDETKGRDAKLRYRSLYPLDQAVVKHDWGINVNDRTAAVLIHIDSSGGYDEPTIG